MSGIVFINCRRKDAAGMAGRLFDRLEQDFSDDQLLGKEGRNAPFLTVLAVVAIIAVSFLYTYRPDIFHAWTSELFFVH